MGVQCGEEVRLDPFGHVGITGTLERRDSLHPGSGGSFKITDLRPGRAQGHKKKWHLRICGSHDLL